MPPSVTAKTVKTYIDNCIRHRLHGWMWVLAVLTVTHIGPFSKWDDEDWWCAYEELAAVLEYDQGNPRPEAERLAREQIEEQRAAADLDRARQRVQEIKAVREADLQRLRELVSAVGDGRKRRSRRSWRRA
jgi:hypothetical protein